MYKSDKKKTQSFAGRTKTPEKSRGDSFRHSPEKSQGRFERGGQDMKIRFKRKDLEEFLPSQYVTGKRSALTVDDIIDLKEVFDVYDSSGYGVLLPNDLMLLLKQNGYNANKKTVYEIISDFDDGGAGGLSFQEFLNVMVADPTTETQKQVKAVFKKYDRTNKGYLDINDLREINRLVKENCDEDTLKSMLSKIDSNHDGKISFEDFEAIMRKKTQIHPKKK